MSFPTSFGPAQSTLETTAQTVANAGARAAGVKTAKPVYTVPTNSTLMGSVAMTALIGRVPIDGTVERSIPLQGPGRAGQSARRTASTFPMWPAPCSGTASGDWTLSCVRGQVRSITFVFHDGTIRTIPEDREGNQQNNQQRDGLGWISDPHGIPCVSGERRSNAQQYLGSQALITAAGAGVASLIECDSGSVSVCRRRRLHRQRGHQRPGSGGPDSGGRRAGHVELGQQALRPGVRRRLCPARREGRRPPRKPLAIDFDPEGRKVDHRTGESHALELE